MTDRLKTYLKTYTGKVWPFADAGNTVMEPDHIAQSLALQCRFGGHIDTFYSVAQHCCHCADAMYRPDRIHGLLHDAHEAVIGNIIGPLKRAIDEETDIIRRVKGQVDVAVYRMAGISFPSDEVVQRIKTVDFLMLATEMRDVRTGTPIDARMPPPYPEHILKIEPWPWEYAKKQWLDRYELYRRLHWEATYDD